MANQNEPQKTTVNIFWHPKWNGPDQPENMVTVRDQGKTRSYLNITQASLKRLAKLSYHSSDVVGFLDGYGFTIKGATK